jgi:hypothetical protein
MLTIRDLKLNAKRLRAQDDLSEVTLEFALGDSEAECLSKLVRVVLAYESNACFQNEDEGLCGQLDSLISKRKISRFFRWAITMVCASAAFFWSAVPGKVRETQMQQTLKWLFSKAIKFEDSVFTMEQRFGTASIVPIRSLLGSRQPDTRLSQVRGPSRL